MKKKVWYYEKWVGRHASFPPRRSVKINFNFFQARVLVLVMAGVMAVMKEQFGCAKYAVNKEKCGKNRGLGSLK